MNTSIDIDMDVHSNMCKGGVKASAKWGSLLNGARLLLPARAENVAVARAFLSAMIAARPEDGWDITVSALDELKVALSEAVSNAIIHGYGSRADKNVCLKVYQYRYALVVQVIDNGVGIADIDRAREPDFTTGQEHLGLGFAFMESFTDGLNVESAVNCGTCVTLVKLFKAAAEL